jgi:glycerophosphoryl diester phosphodiesterase
LIARHENRVWKLPIVYDKWKVGVLSRRPLYLPELCERARGGPRLLLDLKGKSARLVPDLIKTLREQRAIQNAALCGQDWSLLDQAKALEPNLSIYYSFGSHQHIDAMRRRPSTAPRVAAASVWERLLTDQLLAELHERKIAVLAWTVNVPERARELLAAGVAGIISDRLDLLAGIGLPPEVSGTHSISASV